MAVSQKITRQLRVPGRIKNAENKRRSEKAKELALQGIELRKAGVSYSKIAEAIGYSSASNAKRGIDRFMMHQIKDASTEVVEMDLMRLDEYMARCTNAMRSNGDLSQIDRLLRITEAKYRLLGISDDTLNVLREQHGVTTKIDVNNVMVVQSSQVSEEEFIKRMMQAVNIDPTTNDDAAQYIAERFSPKEITASKENNGTKITNTKSVGTKGKSGKKRIIKRKTGTRRPLLTDPHAPDYISLSEDEIIDAEIV